MRAFVTGGSGFLGSGLVKFLLKKRYKVSYASRRPKKVLNSLGAEYHCCDIRNFDALSNAFKNCDIVFHVAAKTGIWGNLEDYYSINVKGTENVINACLKNRIKNLVYTGSPSCVFSFEDQKNIDECTPYPQKFLNPYSYTKAVAEDLALNSPLSCVSLRPHLIWGPEDTNIIPRIIERSKKNRLIQIGSGKNLVDIVYIDNAVYAHFLAGEKLLNNQLNENRPYFITQEEPVNLWNFLTELLKAMNLPGISKTISFNTAYKLGYLIELIYKKFKIEKEPPLTRFLALQMGKSHYYSKKYSKSVLGYSPIISTEEGIIKTAQYYLPNK
jgi:nucleoside-diphosphate-sugar epimerase